MAGAYFVGKFTKGNSVLIGNMIWKKAHIGKMLHHSIGDILMEHPAGLF